MNHKEVRMEQTELLWQYQQADMAADAFETEIKRNPNRLQLWHEYPHRNLASNHRKNH